jgi:GT2 family glycosyltransferase
MEPFVSVVLVSYNSLKHIEQLLNSLKKQTYKNFNILFVDNNSSDDSVKIASKFKGIKIIQNKENYGFAKGNNIGIREAFKNKKTKYVICLNLDMVPDKNWLKELVRVAEKEKKVGSIQSKVLLHNKPNKINTTGNDVHFLGINYCGDYLKNNSTNEEIKQINYSSGSSVLYVRKALEETGLFDEDLFMYHEDLDLGWRLKLNEYKNFLAPNSITYHKYSFSKESYKFYYLERNRLIVLLKNYNFKTLILISPAMIFFEMGMISYSLFNGFFIKKMKSYFDFLLALPRTISKRKKVQKSRKMSDKDIIKSFVARIEFEEVKNPVLDKFANPILELYWKLVRRFI